MSGSTGATGGAGGGLPGAAQGGEPYGGIPRHPAEPPAASTSMMPSASGGGPSAGGRPGHSVPAPPTRPPAAASGFSPPTTYTKGQPSQTRGTRVPGAGGKTRKARLRATRIDPWSVMKVSSLVSLAVGVVIIVASAVLWLTLDGLGVFGSLGSTLKQLTGSDTSAGVNIMDYVGFGQVMTFTVLVAVVDVVLLTALCTLSAFIYNIASGFTGGIELTLAEED